MSRSTTLPGLAAGTVLALTLGAGSGVADVPSVLMAQGGGSPPGYNEPTYFDPDYVGDQSLVSYNDPFAGQSDAALKAQIAPLQQTSLNAIFNLSGIGGQSDAVPVRGTKSTQWKGVIGSRDTFGGPAIDPLTGRTNTGSEEFIGDAFYSTVDRQRWDQFVTETTARRERLEGSIQNNVRKVQTSLQSTITGANPQFDSAAYDGLDRDLALLEGDLRRERNILQEELKNANDKFLGYALMYEQQMNEEEKAFLQHALFMTLSAGVGAGGMVAGGLSGTGAAAIAPTLSLADWATIGGISSLQTSTVFLGVVEKMDQLAGSSPAHRSALEKMRLAQAPIKAVKGAYDASVQDIQRLQGLRNDLKQAKQVNQSLYYRATGGLQCSSPCTLGSLGPGLDHYVSQAAYYFAGRSPQGAAVYNAFGPVSQFDQRWINERSGGPISPFDHSWINERSEGPISQFDHTWINERSIGPEDMASWTQKFPSTRGMPGANPDDAFGGLSAKIVADLQGVDARALFEDASRKQITQQLASGLIQEFNIDPAVASAIANGTLIAITQSLNNNPGGLTGGPSTGGFTDITLQLPLLFEVFDFATIDGDIITLRVTDTAGLKLGPLQITLSGPATADTFAPEVLPGRIEISITAENTGQLFPNTGQVRILSNITEGSTTQQFNLLTGETGVLAITATPPP